MKKTNYIAILSHAFMALVTVGALTSCADDAGLFDKFQGGNGDGLTVAPVVSEPTLVTRATTASDATVKEEELLTLDVFVESQENLGTIMKQYHRTSTDNIDAIGHQVQSLLAENWRAEGLVVGKKYNIYVAVNNPLTTETISTVAALKALTYNEVTTDHVAVINEENNNVTWGETTTSGNIYKLYDANPGSARALTSDKKFMMDGILENWTPATNTRDQVFQPVTLNRAAAKIVLNVDFDADFVKSLKQEKKTVDGVETWVDKPADQQVAITGSPAWKFYNFAFGAPVFTPETAPTAGVEVHNSDFNIFHNQSCEDGASFQIITYTYPSAWAQADYATKAPSLVISIPYTEGTGDAAVTNYGYYRIPLLESTTTSVDRNHIYVVNATIATRGSELHEDVDEIKDVHYYVLPWNDENNSAAIHNEVEAVQHLYLKVNPKIYTLRGDGAQSVDINYLKASGTSVGWKLFTYDAQGNQVSVVANDADGAKRAWFYNSTGAFTSTYSDTGSGINWGNTMGVDIVQSTEGVSGTSGKFTVTSQALTNKAIKYIRFRVFLNDDETLYEDVIIRHFPTDNIQNIAGHWSSYHTANNSTQDVTLTTTILSEAQSWAEQYGVAFTSQELSNTETITYATYSAHSTEEGYSANIVSGVTVNEMYQAAGYNWNNTIRNANGQANAFLSDGWYYWGENPTTTNNNNYDYYTGNYGNRTYYIYTTRYRAQYTHTYSYTQYSITVPMASTGDWVDWDNRTSHSPARTYNTTYGNNGGSFYAKVYNNGIYQINEQSSGGYNATYTTVQGSNYSSLTNNRMYVIQISSTSNDYILGRPILGNPNENQSKDDVVSPAFMIASQLGAVTTFTNAANAATHCRRYMEVAEDGTRYTGWRLPTKSEISVITGYQYGTIGGVTIPNDYRVLSPVLTGRYYWSLSGDLVLTLSTNDSGNYLRCVRDLSAEEVDRLNGFDKIIQKYQNK